MQGDQLARRSCYYRLKRPTMPSIKSSSPQLKPSSPSHCSSCRCLNVSLPPKPSHCTWNVTSSRKTTLNCVLNGFSTASSWITARGSVFTSQFQNVTNLLEGDIAHFEATLTPVGDQTMTVEWFYNGQSLKSWAIVNVPCTPSIWLLYYLLKINKQVKREKGDRKT